MRYPQYNCPECGHRLFGHADGGAFCPECGYYFGDEDGGYGQEREPEDDEREPGTEAASPDAAEYTSRGL